jgi:type I restriction enzyme S subunit
MGSNWIDCELGDVIELKRGYDLPKTTRVAGTIPVVSSSGESGFHNESKVKAPGVVTGRYGTIGEVFYLDIDFWPLNTTLYVRDFKGNDPLFIYYFLKTISYSDYTDKAAVPGINRNHIHKAKVKIPESVTYQQEIAKNLRDLDNKITLNRQINQTLEQMAQALFKSWFVDFDPVVDNALDAGFFDLDLAFPDELLRRAEARRAMREHADVKPLPEATSQLFPAAFEECAEPSLGLGGWVPKGWENIAIYSLAEFVNGAAYKAFEPNLDKRGLPIIKIAELKAGVTAQTAFSDQSMPEKYRLTTGDILFSWSGNPDTSIDTFIWTYGDAWLNQHIFKVSPPNITGERSFVLIALKSLRPIFAETARNKQTTGLGHVTVADLKRLQIMKPGPNILAAWDHLVSPYVNQILALTLQAQTLAQLRDTLLPKLISGELRLDNIAADLAKEGVA